MVNDNTELIFCCDT